MIRLLLLGGVGYGVYWLYKRSPAGGGSGSTPVSNTPDFDFFDFFSPVVPVDNLSPNLPPVGGGGGVGTRGIRNNNPGNIKWSSANNWKGQTGKDAQGFVIFDKVENGVRALSKLLDSYDKAGVNTIEGIVRRYTAGDNAVIQGNYMAALEKAVGVKRDYKLNKYLHRIPLVAGIINFENGKQPWTIGEITLWSSLA